MRLRLPVLTFLFCSWTCAQLPVLTYHNDQYRMGWYWYETRLSPSTVRASAFGKLFTLPADGKVDAEPLYVPRLSIDGVPHNVVFVATEHNTLYAYDADAAGAPLWKASLMAAGETPSDDRGCGQVTPEIGITATPAIDLSVGPHGTIYAVAMSKDSSGEYFHRLHAIDIATGQEEFGGPVEIRATYPGSGDESANGTVIFAPGQHKERAALLISQGAVITTWSSHCDIRPYTGWVMTYDRETLQQRSILNFTPNGREGAVWQSGAGPAADGGGNIYFLAANGDFDTSLNAQGFPVKGNYGNAFLKISNTANGLAVADYFNMFQTAAESRADQDLGSGGAMLLPDQADSAGAVHRLAVGAGKDQNIYVVDRENMGKFHTGFNAIYQELDKGLAGGEFGMPAYFNGTIYFGAVNDSIRAFTIQNAKLTAASVSGNRFGYPGTTPSVSSFRNRNAIVWAVENGLTAVLHAYDATDLTAELYNSNQTGSRDHFGSGNKYITPMIANSRVYVGTTNGVAVFGLLHQSSVAAALRSGSR